MNKRPVFTNCEEQSQKSFITWLYFHNRDAWEATHHSPNGGNRGPNGGMIGKKLKDMGTKPGFPDLMTWYPVGPYFGCMVEFKVRAKPTPEQIEWLARARRSGWKAEVISGLDNLIAFYTDYLEGRL